MKQRLLRLRAVLVSVILGVGFFTAVLAMNDSLWHTTEQSLAESLDGYSHVVDPATPQQAEPLSEALSDLHSIPRVDDAVPAIDSMGFVARGTLTDAIRLRSMEWLPPDADISTGTAPQQDGQVVLNANVAAEWGITPGDTIRVHNSPVAEEYGTVEVSGLVALPSESPLPGADMAIYGSVETLNLLRGLSADHYSQIFVASDGSPEVDQALQAHSAIPVESFVAGQARSSIPGAEYLTVGVYAVSVAAFFVLALVIRAVFSIRVEQDRREYALMRCLGASRAQVFGSVLVGVLSVGVVGALLGLVLATVLVAGVLSLPGVPMSFDLSFGSVGIAFTAGLVICLIGALGPARQATQSAPLEAFTMATTLERPRTKVPIIRLVLLGLSGLGLVLTAQAGILIGTIAFAFLLAVGALTLIGPITRATARIMKWMLGTRPSVALTEAVDNIRARPRRATSISSLVAITVAFIALVGTGSSTVLASMNKVFTDVPSPDIAIELDTNAASPEAIHEKIQGLERVETSVTVATATIDLATDYDEVTGATAVQTTEDLATVVHRPDYLHYAESGTVFLGHQFGFNNRDQLEATSTSGQTFSVDPVVREEGTTYAFFAPEDFNAMFPETQPEIWVSFHPEADLEAAVNELTVALSGAAVSYGNESTAERIVQIDNYLSLITIFALALLSIGVLIAFIGISNTLRLTVIERRQEIGLQRALGLLKSQLRAALTSETVVLTVLGGVTGLVLGVSVAVAGVHSLASSVEGLRFSLGLPAPFFLATLLAAILIAITAALLASNKATRVSPIAAITSR